MDYTPVLLVLLSALFHAIWNIYAKKTAYKRAFLWSITAWGAVLLVPLVWIWEKPSWSMLQAAILFPALSVLAHTSYTFCLGEAYRRVPFTLAYPIARGLAQIFIVLVGLFVFHEHPSAIALTGVLAILGGIQLLAGGWRLREGLQLLRHTPWPFLVAACICAYTSFDHRSVQTLPPLTVCLLANTGQCLFLAPMQLKEFRRIGPGEWAPFLGLTFIMGIVSTAGYCLFLAVQHMGGLVSLVGPLRETSIIIGMVLGYFLLDEPMNRLKWAAGVLLLLGVTLIRFG